jgi:hypothetical protein
MQFELRIANYISEDMNIWIWPSFHCILHVSSTLEGVPNTYNPDVLQKNVHNMLVIAYMALIHFADNWPHALAATHFI